MVIRIGRSAHDRAEVDVAQLLPSTETPSISYGGVGSLPGRRDEAGVAVLPDERIHPSGAIELFLVSDSRRLTIRPRSQSLSSSTSTPLVATSRVLKRRGEGTRPCTSIDPPPRRFLVQESASGRSLEGTRRKVSQFSRMNA